MQTTAPHDELKVTALKTRLGAFELSASFSVGAGERVALVGQSGSGKSTLLRTIAGLEPIQEGAITLGATSLSTLKAAEREIGFVFQASALFPALSVLENAGFGLRMRGVSRVDREKQVLPWLERAGLAALRDRSVDALSGGEAQRVAWVRALVWKPRLILLDEPFSALDRETRVGMQKQLLDLHALWPVPLLLVSHDEQEVAAVATRVLRVREHESGTRGRVFWGEESRQRGN
jgi:ABC-type Fe3+/spermidine/putrescine transport system ATPase subunit